MSQYQHIIRAVLAKPWAIDPDSLAWAAILDVLALRASGGSLTDQEIRARIEAAANGPRAGGTRNRNVAVIPIYGVISPRQNLMARTSGGATAESIRDDFRAALADPDVDGIVFDVDSPGGVVEGIEELASEIRAARGQKPIAAVANHLAASAAYWAISGVDEIVATTSASVGSIGVFTAHQDVSAAMEKEGVRTTLISAGKYKVERSQYAPLGEEALAAVQDEVDAWYSAMTTSIARGRGTSVETVRSGYGEGRSLLAKKALDRGMVDRIDTLENTIRRVARGAVGQKPKAVALAGATYLAAVDVDAASAEDQDEAGAAPSFSDRIEAVAAEVQSIAGEARKRADLRAEEGRSGARSGRPTLSEATRENLLLLADSLRDVAEPVVEEEPEAGATPDPVPDPTPEARRPRRDLELLEAAARGGYSLPS